VVELSATTRAVTATDAEAMAAVSKRPVADELAALQALTQAGLRGLALWYVTLALFFTASALYLRRAVPDDDPGSLCESEADSLWDGPRVEVLWAKAQVHRQGRWRV